MPIYEFYCSNCHMLFSFLSKTMDTKKRPMCPRCKKKELDRQISMFAMTGQKQEADGPDDLPLDEGKMERAITELAGKAENMNDDDPRQAVDLMRKFSSMTGIEYGKSMEEALNRMEAGEDPDAIEKEMGDLMDSEEEPFLLPGNKKKNSSKGKKKAPDKDPKLYEM